MSEMREDAKVILLLCGPLGGPAAPAPLELREYNQVVRWLVGQKLGLADLLAPKLGLALAKGVGLDEERVTALLKRGVVLGFAVEKWSQSGIWVVCRSDEAYPRRFKEHLKEKAPPILFGAGEQSLLQGGGSPSSVPVLRTRTVKPMRATWPRGARADDSGWSPAAPVASIRLPSPSLPLAGSRTRPCSCGRLCCAKLHRPLAASCPSLIDCRL